MNRINTEAVTERLMRMLDIRNKEEQSVGITMAHINEIKEYLAALVRSYAEKMFLGKLVEFQESTNYARLKQVTVLQ